MTSLRLTALALVACSLFSFGFAQNTTVHCEKGYEWMNNELHQNPCLVAAWLYTPCYSPADSIVPEIDPGWHYIGPSDPFQSSSCICNTVMYSLLSACGTCQGQGKHIIPWPVYSTNCSDADTVNGTYPEKVPNGTEVPFWAYLDVMANDTFNAVAAKEVAERNITTLSLTAFTSTASVTPLGVILSSAVTSASLTVHSTSVGTTSPSSEADASSSVQSNHTDALIGGIVGGALGMMLIGTVALFMVLRHMRWTKSYEERMLTTSYALRNSSADSDGRDSVLGLKSGLGGVPVYDPNDPRTFPSTPPPAQTQLRRADSTAGTVALAHSPSVLQSTYTGKPEVTK